MEQLPIDSYMLLCKQKNYTGPILEIKGMLAIFQKKGKKEQNMWKFGQKCTKFENIFKKGRSLRANIVRNKLLE